MHRWCNQELHRVAARPYMARERPGHTAAADGARQRGLRSARGFGRTSQWQNRAHFFAVAAGIMRRILVDVARARDRDQARR